MFGIDTTIDLGASDIYGGGGLRRNSLASATDEQGRPTYDNASIERMMARQGQTANISSDTRMAESERKSRLSDLNSQLFRLGTLNSRGKRQMAMAIQGQIHDLTRDNYSTQNTREIRNAELAHAQAANNANLRNLALDRNQRDYQFGAVRADKRDAMLEEAANNRLRSLMDLQKHEDEAPDRLLARQRAAQEMRLAEDGYVNDRINSLVKDQGMSRQEAEAQVMRERVTYGLSPQSSGVTARMNDDAIRAQVAMANKTGVVQSLRNFAHGRGYTPFNKGKVDPNMVTSTQDLQIWPTWNPQMVEAGYQTEDGKRVSSVVPNDDPTLRLAGGLAARYRE